MKKFTKRLTMIVAILLSLVLLSSSIVSTTLAKYVTSKKATTTATLSKFGVEVKLEGIGTTPEKKGDSITYTDTITLIPDDKYKVIKASIKGKPSVAAIINIDVDLEYIGNYTIEGNKDFTDITSETTYYPVGFKVASNSASTAYTVTPYSNVNGADASIAIEKAIKNKLSALKFEDPTNADGLSNTWSTSTNIDETDISLYFHWPKTYGTAEDMYDEIGTYLSKDGAQKVKITYTISVTQK